LPYLAKDRPLGLRVKAIGALGWSSFQEAVPALSAIAKDETENESIRAQALNPGLRYMKSADAVATATFLATHKSDSIRGSAYWVLSDNATDSAIKVLSSRLGAEDKPLLGQLIYALYFSKHPQAGRIVFDLVDFTVLQDDRNALNAYATTMEQYRIPEAQQHMLAVAQQPAPSLAAYYASAISRRFPVRRLSPL
jgi:HEAT repeat protein